jgi:hypothetical protein
MPKITIEEFLQQSGGAGGGTISQPKQFGGKITIEQFLAQPTAPQIEQQPRSTLQKFSTWSKATALKGTRGIADVAQFALKEGIPRSIGVISQGALDIAQGQFGLNQRYYDPHSRKIITKPKTPERIKLDKGIENAVEQWQAESNKQFNSKTSVPAFLSGKLVNFFDAVKRGADERLSAEEFLPSEEWTRAVA